MSTLKIDDLPGGGGCGDNAAQIRALTRDEMKDISGGRAVTVLVDGMHTGTVDDFAINMAIFEGRIKGSYI